MSKTTLERVCYGRTIYGIDEGVGDGGVKLCIIILTSRTNLFLLKKWLEQTQSYDFRERHHSQYLLEFSPFSEYIIVENHLKNLIYIITKTKHHISREYKCFYHIAGTTTLLLAIKAFPKINLNSSQTFF